jgi:glycosyltransferase involved in cell wall biosynthesis
VNLVGYLTREASLGDVARRLGASVRTADVATSWIAYHRSASPELPDAPAVDQIVAYDTTLAVVTADQFPSLAGDHPELFRVTQRMIGYWFWELEQIPRAMRDAIRFVDEVWAGSRFVADAFSAVTRKPVRYVPIPVPQPVRSCRGRAEFAPLADVGDRFVFLVVFDHLSVTERKNPAGAIRAFRQAFPTGDGPVLVVKSMNADLRWRQHQAVLAAAGDRTDIRFWDEHLTRDDQMALVATADCLVSLHRSEGLGLHLAEAMWLGTPTIATRYSGNVDFMDDSCALLIDAGRVKVGRGGQGVYPPDAEWADPDLGQAAEAMSRIAGDDALADRLAEAGRARMQAQPSLAETGQVIAGLLRTRR